MNATHPAREEHDALLFVGIGPGKHNATRLVLAGVVRQMGHARRNVQKFSGLDGCMFLQHFPIPHFGLAAYDVNGRFMVFVKVRILGDFEGELGCWFF